jgi:hypothetical protein
MADVSKRFTTTAEEMRTATAAMQRELLETRGHLQKGLLEMPTEAREASAAMRRAIGEQIEAINELSKIVARYSGETLLPPAPPPVVEPAAKPAAAAAATSQRPTPRQVEARDGEGAGGAEPFGRPANGATGGAARPMSLPAAQPLVARARAGNGEGRGWVADLLRRASSPEDETTPASAAPRADAAEPAPPTGKRSPAQVVESLNSLSIDIARAIDHEASVELWDRYKRGERNVFTRRLYTLQGQKTFDELRRKYEKDADFRQAVDNYIGDFERLLAQVSRDDQDPAMARMYLTSDTGKVYTMLAHAAGRLG